MPLTPDHEKYLNDILNYWEHKTSSVERYRCDFQRHEYEMTRRTTPNNGMNYEFVRKTYTEGRIQYAAPDKGLFKAEVIKHRTPPKQPGGPPVWEEQVGGPREHWICDGASIFEFNYPLKQLIVRPLPPDMKGKQIAEGPLPFMFGAKAAQIKRRFWVRVVTPPNTEKEYHLQAVPRTLQDAQNLKELLIVIAERDFLPKGMVMFHLNKAKTSYEFKNREVNWNTTLEDVNIFKRAFFAPALPARDWKKVVVPTEQAAAGPARQAARGAAVRPPFGPVRQAQTPRGRQAPR
jgi:TIGR03009 family protein